MKMIRRFISFVIIISVIFSAIDITAFAAEDEEFVVNSNGVLTEYNGSGGDVVIPNNLGIKAIGARVFMGDGSITSISIPEGVTDIGTWAFYISRNLIAVRLPHSLNSIGVAAFFMCPLTDVYYYGNESDWNNISIGSSNGDLTNATIHYITSNPGGGGITVTFDLNYNSGGIYEIQEVESGLEITKPEDPSREGYKFAGWYAANKCMGIEFFSNWNAVSRLLISNDIRLYAKWEPLTSIIDAFSFTNTYFCFCTPDWDDIDYLKKLNYTYSISNGDYKTLLKNLPWYDFITKTIIKNDKKSIWGGSCFGMSAVVCLAESGEIDVKDFEPKMITKLSDIKGLSINKDDCDVSNLESLINYYYLMQNIGSVAAAKRSSLFGNESVNLKSIVDKMLDTSFPVIIGIKIIKPGGKTSFHSVVGYDIEHDTEANAYRIKIYDCNLGNDKFYDLTIEYDEYGKYSKECQEWINDSGGNPFLLLAAVPVEAFQEMIVPKPTSRMALQSTVPYSLTSNYPSFTISDGTTEAIIEAGEKISGDLNIVSYGPQNEIYGELSLLFELPSLGELESYTITPVISEDNEDYETVLSSDDPDSGFYASINADDTGSVTINNTGTITTHYEDGVDQTIVSTVNNAATPWYYLQMTGNDTGFTVESYADETVIKSENNATVSLNIEEDFNNLTFENVELDSDGIRIFESDEGVCAIEKNGEIADSKEFGYSVVFDSRFGSGIEPLYRVTSGSLISVPEEPTRAGYLFEGWYKDEDCAIPWDFGVDVVAENVVLYASWSVDPDYIISVTFRAEDSEDQIIFIPQGSSIAIEDYPDIPERDGLTAYGWETIDLSEVDENTIVNARYNGIESISREGNIITVVPKNDMDCILVIAAYDAAGKQIDVEISEITADSDAIEANISSLPEECGMKAFLISKDNYSPLCNAVSE